MHCKPVVMCYSCAAAPSPARLEDSRKKAQKELRKAAIHTCTHFELKPEVDPNRKKGVKGKTDNPLFYIHSRICLEKTATKTACVIPA